MPEYGLVAVDPYAARARSLPRRDVGRGPALRPRRPDRDGPVDAGRPDQDARLLLQPAEAPHVRVPADRRRCRPASCTSTSACSARRCRCCRSRSARSSRRRSTPTAVSSSTSTSWRPSSSGSAGSRRPRARPDSPPRRYAINLTPFSLLDPAFEASALAAQVREVGLDPRQITIECTEQQSVPDIVPLQRQVKALRKLGFGFAVDDAGAGYASFALIAALRPSIIKIDRDIVHGLDHDDAKQALVEAFVSFGRRIGAHLLAEGIERRADLATLHVPRRRTRTGLSAREAGRRPGAAVGARRGSSARPRATPARCRRRRASRVPSRA